jgi:cytochrome c biogenesis protein CcdA
MVSTLDPALIQPAEMTLALGIWLGVLASANVCAIIRLPILIAYVVGMGNSRRHALILTALFTLGLAGGTLLLGLTATALADGGCKALQVSKCLFWILGLCLAVAGLLISGLIHLQLVPQKWRSIAARLVRADLPGALLLGLVLGLLQTPACPTCRTELLLVVNGGAVGGSSLYGFALLVGFAAGQSLAVLSVGALTGLLRPSLLTWLRRWMCSLEPRMQLLTGNMLIVIGIYFGVVG